MKLFTTPAIKHDPENSDALVAGKTKYGYNYWFCKTSTCQIFGLPKNITKVWFEFYNRAGVDRWPIEVIDDDGIFEVGINIDGNIERVARDPARLIIRRLKGRKKCYVACFYETEGKVITGVL